MTELNARRQAVLAIVVQEHIASGSPVGSKTVVEEYQLKVSSATIRNEMKVLEETGLLTHPHTSAGRVPTEEGYRYFVQHLLPDRPLAPADQRMIQHLFHQVGHEKDQWAQLAAAVLAHSSQMGALATQVRVESSRFKHMQLVEVRPGLVLLVLVLHAGVVKQQMISLDLAVTQDDLSQVSNQLNDLLANLTVSEIRDWLPELAPLGQQVLDLVVDTMESEDSPVSEQVYRDGLSHILMQPEFSATEDAHQLVNVLEQATLLGNIFENVRSNDGVQILIGGDGRYDALRDLSLVLSRYGVDRNVTGVLGIVGPVRMHYGRTIPLVRYVAELMSGLVQEWYT
ncbi:MAG: heat-inducible transcription repressor HrcA [Caldilineae bacterium]|nr:heat-inducible transcription repressor HrcA [Anaerolineae bacterium]MCB9154475.1 heat-inducible transcription repressor HrcA [Caldilineae bacterium]